MKDLKGIIEGHTVSELAEIMFKELSNYHFTKLAKGLEIAVEKAERFDYEEKTEPKRLSIGTFAIGVPDMRVEELAKKIKEATERDTIKDKMNEILKNEKKDWEYLGCTVEYMVSEFDNLVKVIIREKETNEIYATGKAICAPGDKFDATTGKLVAIMKASYKDRWKSKIKGAGFGYILD